MENLNYFVHPMALCESTRIGSRTKIWAFTHVLEGSQIGSDCNICEQVFIESGAIIGDRVTIKNGVQLWNGIEVENDVFIGPNVTFTNDKYPASLNKNFNLMPTIIRQGASIGANVTVLPGITIGRNSVIGAGAVVTKDVPDDDTVIGNPAKSIR